MVCAQTRAASAEQTESNQDEEQRLRLGGRECWDTKGDFHVAQDQWGSDFCFQGVLQLRFLMGMIWLGKRLELFFHQNRVQASFQW